MGKFPLLVELNHLYSQRSSVTSVVFFKYEILQAKEITVNHFRYLYRIRLIVFGIHAAHIYEPY